MDFTGFQKSHLLTQKICLDSTSVDYVHGPVGMTKPDSDATGQYVFAS